MPDTEIELKEQFFNYASNGYFVEVGAADPRQESQTWHLEKIGWNGVLIEPLAEFVEKLRKNRTSQVFAVACSSPRNAGKNNPFYVAGPLSSFERDRMASGTTVQTVIEVPTMTLDQILIEAKATPPIDFLSVDVEGHEIEVLQGFDFTRWRPQLVLVEDHVSNLDKLRFMQRVGYRLIRHTHYNGWYVPKGLPVAVGLKDRLRIVRKYFLGLPIRKFRNASRDRRRARQEKSVVNRCMFGQSQISERGRLG